MCVLENSKMLWPGQERTLKILLHASRCWWATARWSMMSIASTNCIAISSVHEGKLLGKLMAKLFKTPSSKLADIMVNHFAIQYTQEQVFHSSKSVDAICKDKQWAALTSHNSNGHTPYAPSKNCPNCTWQHPAGRANYPACDSCCSKCNKMGHWGPKCHSGKPLQPRNASPTGSQQRKSRCSPSNHNHHCGWGNKTDAIDVSEDYSPQDEIALHYIQPNVTIGNTHPEEMMVRDVCVPWCKEAYTTVQLPAHTSRKGKASLHMKVDTRAGGNILTLCVFRCLYPDQISPAGLPTGLGHVSTRLTTYNGSHIPLYGALRGPITWHPDCPGAWPQRVNLYWYVADTPGPTILGLPSSEKLAVVKMNCAIMVRQPSTCPTPVSTTAATTKPATVPEAAKSIRSTDDLIKEFLDWFTGIGRFPGNYKIWLCYNAHPVIHAPRKCPIALCLKVKEHLNKMECLGMITHIDEPTDWVSSVTYIQKANGELHLCLDPCDLNKAICHNHHKIPNVEEVAHESHILASSPSWMPTMDAGQLYSTRTPACLGLSTVPSEDTISCNFPLAWSVPKTSSRRRWSDPWRMPRMYQNHRWHHHPQQHWGGTWCPLTRSHADCLQIWLGVQSTENAHEGSSCQFLWLPLWCQWCPPRPRKGQCSTCLASVNKCHQTPRVPRPSHVPKSLHPWSVHLDCPLPEQLKKDTDFTWNCTYDAAFQQVKEAVISDTTLGYFDPSLPMTIQVNASQVGLGAALLQNGKPIAFASKALTETECQYANIERDARCCLWSREIPHLHLWMVLHN